MSPSPGGRQSRLLHRGARPARHLMGTIDAPPVHCGPTGAAGVCGLLADGYQYLDAFGGTPVHWQPPPSGVRGQERAASF